jgi:hypothetical protein
MSCRHAAPRFPCVRLSESESRLLQHRAKVNSLYPPKAALQNQEPAPTLRKSPRGEQYYQSDQSDQNNFQVGSPYSPRGRRYLAFVFATQWSPADRVNKLNLFHIPLLPDRKTQTQQFSPALRKSNRISLRRVWVDYASMVYKYNNYKKESCEY